VSPRILLLAAFLAALAGYFGPWTWHPAVAFRYSADDLAEFAKFMPVVRSGQVLITRELFFVPIWLASIGLCIWSGRYAGRWLLRGAMGAAAIYASIWPMPTYPFILDAYQSPEFGPAFWTSCAAAIACAAALAFGARIPDRVQAMLWILIGLIGATVAPLHFVRLKPALDALHGWTMGVGWGIGAVAVGFLGVAAIGVIELRRRRANVD
jgi:hypothetical protein